MLFTTQEIADAVEEFNNSAYSNDMSLSLHHAVCWIWLSILYNTYNSNTELSLQEDNDLAKFLGRGK